MPPIEGIDVSGNAQGPINWPAVRGAGVRFVYVKATEGSGFTDPRYYANRQAAVAAGLRVGAYHFWRHDVDPRAQVEHFLRVIGPQGPGWLPPMLDVEGPGDHAGPIRFPISELPARLQYFLGAVDAATGRRTGVYTYRSVWQVTFGNPVVFTHRPLWYADYTPPPDRLPGGWADWTIWQYTSEGRVAGIGTRVDRNHFRGTEAELDTFAGLPEVRVRHFPETGFPVGGAVLEYFEKNGGLGRFGYPVTGEESGEWYPYSLLPELRGYTVQRFERGLLHWKAGEGVGEGRLGAVVSAMLKER